MTFVVSFLDGSDSVSTREVSEPVSVFLDAVRVANDAHMDLCAAAVDAVSELFGSVKIPKNADKATALVRLRAYDAGMGTLRGLLYPTHPRFDEFRDAVKRRDALPKGKRTAEQKAVSDIRNAMKSRIEYILTQALDAYVSDVLGLEYGNGKKRSEAARLETLTKSLTGLKSKGKDERVKFIVSAMLDAANVAGQNWMAKLKKSKAKTLEGFPAPAVRKPRRKGITKPTISASVTV